MALEYFLYRTDINNTLVDRGVTSFAPLPPNTSEILINFFIPENQPLYFYRESGSTIIFNSDENINTYLSESEIVNNETLVTIQDLNNYVSGGTTLGGNTIFVNKVGQNLRFKGLVAGNNISLSPSANTLTISSTGGGASSLSGLTDVQLSGLTNNDFIIYNTGTTKWENIQSESFATQDITDTVNNGDVLFLSGTTILGYPLGLLGVTGVTVPIKVPLVMGVSAISPITIGQKGLHMIGYSGKIKSWTLISDQPTTIVLDVWKANNTIPTLVDSIFGTKPSLSNSQINSATGLNIEVSANDVFILNVDSNNNAKYIKLEFLIQ